MITIQVNGLEEAMSKFDRIKSPKLRKAILQKAGRQVAKSSKARINAQTDLTGARFTPAADGSKRKLLIGKPHGKGLRNMLKVLGSNADEVVVGWSNRLLAHIAYKHQYGSTEPTKARKRKNQADPNAPATRQIAKSLIAAGFKMRRAGKGHKTPSIKWITENMKMGQAGLILRAIRHSESTGVTQIPARSFLGFTPEDLSIMGEILNAEIEAALGGA